MIPISTFRNEILADVPGCPIPRVDEAIVEAARVLCEDTFCLEKTFTSSVASLSVSTNRFPNVLPFTFGAVESGDTEASLVRTVDLSSRDFMDLTDPIQPTFLEINNLKKRLAYFDFTADLAAAASRLPSDKKLYYIDDSDRLKIYPLDGSEALGVVILTVALKPAIGVASLDRFFYRDYRLAVKSQALYLLQKLPGKEWSNADLAAFNLSVYNEQIGIIRIDRSDLTWNDIAQGGYF